MGSLLIKIPHSDETATLEVLSANRVTQEHFAWLRSDVEYRKRVAQFMRRGAVAVSPSEQLARKLMCGRFWGVEEWAEHYGLHFHLPDLQRITEFPWGEDVLRARCPFAPKSIIARTHFAFLGLVVVKGVALDISGWDRLCPNEGPHQGTADGSGSTAPCWYNPESFTRVTGEFRWYLMPLVDVGNPKLSYGHQIAQLPETYEVPLAVEEVARQILGSQFNLFSDKPRMDLWVRDLADTGGRVLVCRSLGQLSLRRFEGFSANIAASRKLPT